MEQRKQLPQARKRNKINVSSQGLRLKEPCSPVRGLLLFHPLHAGNETGVMPHENCQNSASNATIDYSMVKCKLMEPRIGTGYTFSE